MKLFTQTKEIEKKYREWARENNVPDTAFNVITFLSGTGLLVETMDAVTFLEEMDRMCRSVANTCHGCPIHDTFPLIDCADIENRYPREVVGLVKHWSEEHKE